MKTSAKIFSCSQSKTLAEKIAKEFGTPCFVYDENSISENYNQIKNVFAQEKRNIFYCQLVSQSALP